MHFISEVLLICLILSLYFIFTYSKDNFVLLRKNVTLEQLFNIAFICFIFGVIGARVFYVLENPSLRYLNPLILILFPYFPGLSLSGGIICGFAVLYYLIKRKKLPFPNIIDIFSLSLFPAVLFGTLFAFMLNFFFLKKFLILTIVAVLMGVALCIILTVIYLKNGLKDGSIGFFSLAIVVFHQFLMRFFERTRDNYFRLSKEDVLLILIVIFFIILTIHQEASQPKKKI